MYAFTEGGRDMAGLLGGKGANLAEMTRLGLPVPPGFTVTTEACRTFLTTGSEPPGSPVRSPLIRPGWRRPRVGRLAGIAVAEGRAARPDLKIGVCGEHGGDPDSVHSLRDAGLDYVSCSPFRVPVARLEAGRVALPGAADR